MREEERRYAALAHLLAIVPGWGILGDAGIWLVFKERSREIVFHAQQAIFFQVSLLLFVVVYVVISLVEGILRLISEGLANFIHSTNLFFLTLCYVVYALVCLYGAFRVLSGGEFQYPVIGQRMAEGFRRQSGE